MIASDHDLQVTLERIAWLQQQAAHLRKTETNPAKYRDAVAGFLVEIEALQRVVRDYFLAPLLAETAALEATDPAQGVADPLQDELKPIYLRLTQTLIEATPEHWGAVLLELTVPEVGFGSGLNHAISSAEHPHDVVVVTDDVLEATQALERACLRHGEIWRRCLFRVTQEPSGGWRYSADYE